ncbi:Fur family transcriptional regulator [Helcococcus kunzii]|uniref:Fur family transcriptional regulator n=1 Tax=Helcococcus kunzii TaxID=40091 RepID=UPI0024ACA720|nr:Fur family transcriptional regulator [Helcococcus kunzii]
MDILKDKGLKSTKTRTKILNLLKENSPLTAEQIYEHLMDSNIKLSSIYRNLAIFVDENIVIKSVGFDNISYYQLNTDHHKHQIVCTNCNKVVMIENCPLHEIEKDLEKSTGFKIMSHSFEFSGLCEDCQNKINS